MNTKDVAIKVRLLQEEIEAGMAGIVNARSLLYTIQANENSASHRLKMAGTDEQASIAWSERESLAAQKRAAEEVERARARRKLQENTAQSDLVKVRLAIAEARRQISDLLSQLEERKERLEALRVVHRPPFLTLPPEIFTLIVVDACDDMNAHRIRTALLGVSKVVNAFINDTAVLWTHVKSSYPLAMLDRSLVNSKTLPLKVSIILRSRPQRFTQILDKLVHHISQWKELVIHGHARAALPSLRETLDAFAFLRAPALKKLDVAYIGSAWAWTNDWGELGTTTATARQFLQGGTPKLESVRVSDMDLNICLPPLSTVTTAAFYIPECWSHTPTSHLRNTLSQFSAVTHLVIQAMSIPVPSSSVRIVLEKLVYLELQRRCSDHDSVDIDTFGSAFFQSVTTPILDALTLSNIFSLNSFCEVLKLRSDSPFPRLRELNLLEMYVSFSSADLMHACPLLEAFNVEFDDDSEEEYDFVHGLFDALGAGSLSLRPSALTWPCLRSLRIASVNSLSNIDEPSFDLGVRSKLRHLVNTRRANAVPLRTIILKRFVDVPPHQLKWFHKNVENFELLQ